MSIYGDILLTVQSKINGLHLAGVDNVAVRKLPTIEDTLDTLPIVCVVPSDRERVDDSTYEKDVDVHYTVQIVYVAAGNRDYENGLQTILDVRQRIRRALQGGTLAGVPYVWDVSVDPEAPFDREELNKNYDYSAITFVFRVNEDQS